MGKKIQRNWHVVPCICNVHNVTGYFLLYWLSYPRSKNSKNICLHSTRVKWKNFKCCSHWNLCLAVLLYYCTLYVIKLVNIKLCWGRTGFVHHKNNLHIISIPSPIRRPVKVCSRVCVLVTSEAPMVSSSTCWNKVVTPLVPSRTNTAAHASSAHEKLLFNTRTYERGIYFTTVSRQHFQWINFKILLQMNG